MIGGAVYYFLYCLVSVAFFFWHPVFRVKGRDNVPRNGRMVICANHSGMADPLWVCLALRLGHIPRIMAKKEAMEYPIIGKILNKLGVFGVDRDAADVHAVKIGMRALRNDEQLLIFPEGTRIRKREDSKPKRGAVTLASRTDSSILPVFVTMRTYPWQPVTVVIGEAYRPVFAEKKATDEELEQATLDLMDKIYALEAKV